MSISIVTIPLIVKPYENTIYKNSDVEKTNESHAYTPTDESPQFQPVFRQYLSAEQVFVNNFLDKKKVYVIINSIDTSTIIGFCSGSYHIEYANIRLPKSKIIYCSNTRYFSTTSGFN